MTRYTLADQQQRRAPRILLSFRKRKENYSRKKKSIKLKKIKKRWLSPQKGNIHGWAGMCKWQVTSVIEFWGSVSSQCSASPATEGSHSLKEQRELNTAKPSSLKIHCTFFFIVAEKYQFLNLSNYRRNASLYMDRAKYGILRFWQVFNMQPT